MDDIVIFTKTFADHLAALDAVLTRLGESGIQLRADKCVLGVHNLEFLGFELSEKGIKPQKWPSLKALFAWIVVIVAKTLQYLQILSMVSCKRNLFTMTIDLSKL